MDLLHVHSHVPAVNHFIGISRFSADVRVDNCGAPRANVPFDNGASRHVAPSFTPALARRCAARNCAVAAAKAGIHGVNPIVSRPRAAAKDGGSKTPAGTADIRRAGASHFVSMVRINAPTCLIHE
jgi:hypothetical protein